MSDQEIQETELHDDVENENEIVSEAQEPKGAGDTKLDPKLGKDAEKASAASVDKAAGAVSKAPARKGDKSNAEPMPKTKAGMINAMYGVMSGMKKDQLQAAYSKMMEETDLSDEEIAAISEEQHVAPQREVEVKVDFSDDLNALVESEATLSDEFKAKTATIFEAAVKSKVSQEIDRLEENYQQELAEEIQSTKDELVEKVDSYLNYVVENWMKENQLAIQNGLRAEIAEDFMSKLKDLFTESYIEVPESKVDLVDDLAEQVEELEAKLNKATEDAIATSEILEGYKRESIVREAASGLAETEVEKLKSLVEGIDFEDEAVFAKKVKTIKESYFVKKTTEVQIDEDVEEDNGETIEVSGAMSSYLSTLQRFKSN